MRSPWQRRTRDTGVKEREETRTRRERAMPLVVVDRCHAQGVARCCGCTAFFPYTALHQPTTVVTLNTARPADAHTIAHLTSSPSSTTVLRKIMASPIAIISIIQQRYRHANKIDARTRIQYKYCSCSNVKVHHIIVSYIAV